MLTPPTLLRRGSRFLQPVARHLQIAFQRLTFPCSAKFAAPLQVFPDMEDKQRQVLDAIQVLKGSGTLAAIEVPWVDWAGERSAILMLRW